MRQLPTPVLYEVTEKGSELPALGSKPTGSQMHGNPRLYDYYVKHGFLKRVTAARKAAKKNVPKVREPGINQ